MKIPALVVLILVAVIVSGCSSQVLHAEYQHTATYAVGPFSGGDPFPVTWAPKQLQPSASEPYDVRLCIGIFGPYPTIESLKQALAGGNTPPDCPPADALVASETAQLRSDDGRAVTLDLKLPTAAGFYGVHQIVINGTGANRTMGGGIIEIRSR